MKIVLIFHKKRNIDTFEKYLIPFFLFILSGRMYSFIFYFLKLLSSVWKAW